MTTIKTGDFVTAKGVKYENHQVTGTCTAVKGDKIVVRDRIGIMAYECHLEGAAIVPKSAIVTASRADNWQCRSEPIKMPERDSGLRLYTDRTALQVLLAGICASTISAVRSFVMEHDLEVDTIKAELRFTEKWVTDRPSQYLGGGMTALGEGHNSYTMFIDVQVDGIDEDMKLKLQSRQLTYHQIIDLDIIKAKIHIDLI